MLNYNTCILCEDSISDPVCRSCYINQIGSLLYTFKIHPLINTIILRKIKKKFPIDTLNNMGCILCQREKVTMCRYCFSIILNNILRELNFSEDLIENFGFTIINEDTFLLNEVS